MGSRTADKLKEIEAIRDRVERRMASLEERFPAAGWGRRGAALLASSGLLATLAAFLARRRTAPGRRKKKAEAAPAGPVVVNVVPKGATVVAALGIAVWAGVRLFEAYSRTHASGGEEGFRPSIVRPMPDQGVRGSSTGRGGALD